MNIKIKEESLGEVIVKSYDDIDKDSQCLVKGLSAIIILCLNQKEDPDKHNQLVAVLKKASKEANKIFNEDLNEAQFNATELFD